MPTKQIVTTQCTKHRDAIERAMAICTNVDDQYTWQDSYGNWVRVEKILTALLCECDNYPSHGAGCAALDIKQDVAGPKATAEPTIVAASESQEVSIVAPPDDGHKAGPTSKSELSLADRIKESWSWPDGPLFLTIAESKECVAALRAVEAVRALHQPIKSNGVEWCVTCRDEWNEFCKWPCDTAKAIGVEAVQALLEGER